MSFLTFSGNRPGALDYELSDTSPAIPMPFPQGAQNSANVVPTDPYFNTTMMSFFFRSHCSKIAKILFTHARKESKKPGALKL